MKHVIIILFFTFCFAACLNKNKQTVETPLQTEGWQTFRGDSIKFLSKTNNKIELLKPNYPKLEYLTRDESKGRIYDGIYYKDKKEKPISLKDGEIIVYNRFYQIDYRLIFKDSLIKMTEFYQNGQVSIREMYFHKDSIHITTFFYDDGKPRRTEIVKPNNEKESYLWFKDGKLNTHSIRKKSVEICDFWTEDGYFEQRQRYTYAHEDRMEEPPITQELIDRENRLIKKLE